MIKDHIDKTYNVGNDKIESSRLFSSLSRWWKYIEKKKRN